MLLTIFGLCGVFFFFFIFTLCVIFLLLINLSIFGFFINLIIDVSSVFISYIFFVIIIFFRFLVDLINNFCPIFIRYIFVINFSFDTSINFGFFRLVACVFCIVLSGFSFLLLLIIFWFFSFILLRCLLVFFVHTEVIILIIRHCLRALNWVNQNLPALDLTYHLHELTEFIRRDTTIVICIGD